MVQPSLVGRLRNWLHNCGRSKGPSSGPVSYESSATIGRSLSVDNPVHNYYQQVAETNLSVFSRFALQTRSLAIRDVLAKTATGGQYGLADLLAILEAQDWIDRMSVVKGFNRNILLSLADLLANSARNDLDTHNALQIFDFVYEWDGSESFQDHHKLQYIESLGDTGDYDKLNCLAEEFSLEALAPLQYDLLAVQKARKLLTSPEAWLSVLNDVYGTLGMSQVQLCGDESVPLLDRLASDGVEPIHGPKVSIIMPTYSPGPGIWTALRSLLEQSWLNIEIIVVDDASPDSYSTIFDEINDIDPRVQVIHRLENKGAYVARNAGLAVSTGEFVTTHDDDDWSHPDKVSSQVGRLIEDGSLIATTSAHIRTNEQLFFQRVNTQARYMQMNYSSLMFRKSVITEIGDWDTVNRGGDSEFLTRLIENYGADRVVEIAGLPLSFSRVWSGSLTSGEMSRGYFAYSRILYRWAFRQWHWDTAKAGERAIRDAATARPYAVPSTFEPGDRNADLGLFDIIYVTDFFRQSKFVDFVIDDICALQERDLRIGFMHLSSPQTARPAGFPKILFDLQRQGKITQVSHDDVAETRLLVVYDAAIGMFADELRSSVKTRRALVVEHGLPKLKGGPERRATLFAQCLEHLDTAFATVFKAVGANIEDQLRLSSAVPEARMLPDEMIWAPHSNAEPGQISTPSDVPVVGFHTFGNRYRWPSNAKVFDDVYVSNEYATRFLGNYSVAQEKYGAGAFDQAEIFESGDISERDFLRAIDFWVYFPHERLDDQIWTPVLNAMQAGKVVILPERLAPLYGPAAVYTEPQEVEEVILRLSSDTNAYVSQARQSQKFIADAHDSVSLFRRIAKTADIVWTNGSI